MLLDVLNFLFAYIISGFFLGLFIEKITPKNFNKKLSFILSYGIAPLLISFILYYLYLFFPGKEWFFYGLMIYISFFALFIFSIKELRSIHYKKKLFQNIINQTKALDIFKKILLLFVLLIIIFTVIRNLAYPTTYTDAIDYLRQGFVYSQEHSHTKFNEREYFSDFGENNILYGPSESYKMNKAIRPGFPILYSFFYNDTSPSQIELFSIKFLYTYYFLLLLATFIYILYAFKTKNILIGLTLLLSCYFLTKLSYSNYKAIATAFFSLTALLILYKLIRTKNLYYAIFLGILCGLMSYINYTGLIISGILFLIGLLFYKSKLKQKIFVIVIILLTFGFFSAGEIQEYQRFIFKGSFISLENQEKTFTDSKEFNSRLASEEKSDSKSSNTKSSFNLKMDTLITKKLQAFTQIQFFGFIFWFFLLILLFIIIKKTKLDHFSKINLTFIFLFFFIFFDPFFLNPHKFAYVLSLGYRYSAMLSIFVAIFIAFHYQVIWNIFQKIQIKYLKAIIVFFIFLFPYIRDFTSQEIFSLLNKIIITTNTDIYYLEKINLGLLFLGLSSVLSFFAIHFYEKKTTRKTNPSLVNTLFLGIFFIVPAIFTINNNQNIINTFKYSLDSNQPKKTEEVTQSMGEKSALQAVDYINTNIDRDKIIFVDISPKFLFWLYTDNNKRIISEQEKLNIYEEFYIISPTEDKNDKEIPEKSNTCTIKEKTGTFSLWRCEKNFIETRL